jgi:hypothetical protein
MNPPYSDTILEAEVLPAPLKECPVDPLLHEELLAQVDEQGQVTIRCHIRTAWGTCVRIWPSTYLVCRRTGHRSSMIHAEGITFFPAWMPVPTGTTTFILVFEPLSDECAVFSLVEEIPEPGGFHVPSIMRNGRDLYDVEV